MFDTDEEENDIQLRYMLSQISIRTLFHNSIASKKRTDDQLFKIFNRTVSRCITIGKITMPTGKIFNLKRYTLS